MVLYFVDISRKPDHLPPSGIRKKTPDITYYNTPGKHSTAADTSNSDANHAVFQSDKTKPKVGLSKITQPTSEGKLNFVQVDGFRGKWNFFAFQCPKGSDAVGEFWRFIDDKNIQNIVLLEDISSKVLPAAGGSMLGSTKVICKEEWQKNGIKKFTATINKGKHREEGVYVNQLIQLKLCEYGKNGVAAKAVEVFCSSIAACNLKLLAAYLSCDASSLCMLGAPLSSLVQDQWKRSVSDGEAALASAVAELRGVVRDHSSFILSIAEERRLLLEVCLSEV
ncbi:hypothetical protein CAPTEDRAFT_185667 [Capitella teleta]|uniref:Tyrosine-protein phosphatase domain-containing protein n=1 Tax=Capitella teleta TaxID=283909 RepID=R7VEH3_CAPTE|nr:hypothetical protein CAPTEDRAFT_185667 [Capitella teleta]|eukprot:ELU14080.1 hypothetical protein CAPTEDRAFT_185667 [Capitella teleta]